ncbi:MAG: TonB C-terminal domain-containing protein [Candidatus Aminicenantes bacterium]|nr:TonB C-terminal domain-containing protein [Candidatus Aminicenantes bacterium]
MSSTALNRDTTKFRIAVFISIAAHLILFLLAVLSPTWLRSSKKGMTHYVNLIGLPGGGGGGPGGTPGGGGGLRSASKTETNITETAVPPRETLRDLTIPEKAFQEPSKTALRHPEEKSKREKTTTKAGKKTVIQKRTPTESSPQSSSSSGSQPGSGLGIGLGDGTGEGTGFGSAYDIQYGLAYFPFRYYLQYVQDKVSSNWFKSSFDPGLSGSLKTTVYFQILRNGSISNLRITERSGFRSLDIKALRAVQDSVPFPPLPSEYDGNYLGIHLYFEHSK